MFFDYGLPTELIAHAPPARRTDARLMIVDRRAGTIRNGRFPDIVEILEPGDLVVANDTRVYPARLSGTKRSGGRVEILLLALDGNPCRAILRSSKRLRPGQEIVLAQGHRATIVGEVHDGRALVRIETGTPREVVREVGEIPLPPYVEPEAGCVDIYRDRYQTVYARHEGSVAAPTAGLHFTPELLGRLAARGIDFRTVTLHVGPGTFSPIRGLPDDHEMEREAYCVPGEVLRAIVDARTRGRRVVAVGTTTVRALESVADRSDDAPVPATTDLFIRPGHGFRNVDALLTNFHLPRSTLLCLVAAFAGNELIRRSYETAVAERYRFYSFGDAMLLI